MAEERGVELATPERESGGLTQKGIDPAADDQTRPKRDSPVVVQDRCTTWCHDQKESA